MKKTPRNWTAEQKLAILAEAESNGIASTSRKYELAVSMIGKWKRKLEEKGPDGLVPFSTRSSKEANLLSDENRRLKSIVAEKELELQLLRELLKKRDAQSKTSGRQR